MEDKLSIDGWNYWLRLPNWNLDVALSVLTGYDPRGSNHRHYFKHNTRAKILSDHFISCCLSSASYDEERQVTSIDADPKPPKEWIDAFLLMDDAKLPFPLPDSYHDERLDYPAVNGEEIRIQESELAKMGPRERQVETILAVVAALEYDPLKIPDGGRAKIKAACLSRPKIFTESAFDRAWTKSGVKMLNHEKFSGK
ncbi:MAG: hypothetical protein ABIG70_04865 [Pseudomonadota bacterium]